METTALCVILLLATCTASPVLEEVSAASIEEVNVLKQVPSVINEEIQVPEIQVPSVINEEVQVPEIQVPTVLIEEQPLVKHVSAASSEESSQVQPEESSGGNVPPHPEEPPRMEQPLPGLGCPKECTCEDAPLKAASFVLTWMTSWGEDDLPQFHPNEVMETSDFVVSSTAEDAELDVDVRGLHATCALMPEANLTKLFDALPSRTMVLTVLQAHTENLVTIEAGHLSPLKELKALHLQGYARKEAIQVSGYFPNRVIDMVDYKLKINNTKNNEDQDLLMSISEDALRPLANLQLLDLQYVRLVAALEGGRLRRQTRPLSTSTILDLPIQQFLSLTDQIRGIDLPPEILSKIPTLPPVAELQADIELALLDKHEEENIVSYDVFKSESDVVLAPFISQTQLKYLRVAHAKLDRVGQELLTGLHDLHTLTLEYNHIKVLPAAMFTPTPKLRHLSIAHNNLLMLEENTLAGLDNLLTLDLDHNKIEQLGPGSLPSFPNLATLRLLNNPIEHVFPFTFTNVNATETLLLGSRDVSAEIHVDTFRQLSSLKVLQIENTTLLSLSRALLEGMPNLKELTIHGHVPSIDFDAFTATPNLESLTMSHCQINRLSLDAFFGLSNLRYLDLSSNSIDELSPGTFDHLSSLRELYLQNNNLTTLPLGIFLPLPAKLIQVQNNPWHCTCELLQLKPSLTNKVRAPRYTMCRWDETLGTVCYNEDPVPVKYDSRVAPLCASPVHHSYFDIYHVTSKRLNCPRHKYDPKLTPTLRSRVIKMNTEKEEKEEEETVIISEEEPNWLPLTAFTPSPIEIHDLLSMAEEEMPEEAFAPLTQEDFEEIERAKETIKVIEAEIEDTEEMRQEKTKEKSKILQVQEEEIRIVTLDSTPEQPQNDEQYIRSFEKDVMKQQLENQQNQQQQQQQAKKSKIFTITHEHIQRRQQKRERYLKKRADEKRKMKAQMEEEKKKMRERKVQQLKEFHRQQQNLRLNN